jgi:hypothetical protein
VTEDEKKKMLAGFQKPKQDDAPDPWTDEMLIAAAKRIIKKLKLEGELSNEEMR